MGGLTGYEPQDISLKDYNKTKTSVRAIAEVINILLSKSRTIRDTKKNKIYKSTQKKGQKTRAKTKTFSMSFKTSLIAREKFQFLECSISITRRLHNPSFRYQLNC